MMIEYREASVVHFRNVITFAGDLERFWSPALRPNKIAMIQVPCLKKLGRNFVFKIFHITTMDANTGVIMSIQKHNRYM